jgi:hypothetical protein
VNKMLRNCLCGLGLALLVVSLAAAQESFEKGGVAGVRGLNGHAVLPPAALYTNCGAGCTAYDTGSGYYVSGTASTDGAGQTLATGFSAKKKTAFKEALTPNTNYTSTSGAKISAYLLNGTATGGPTTMFKKLKQNGTIPDYPTIKVIKYTLASGTASFAAGKTYYLCETTTSADATFLWMLSDSDTTTPFFFQVDGSCTKKGITWENATGDTVSAFAIN